MIRCWSPRALLAGVTLLASFVGISCAPCLENGHGMGVTLQKVTTPEQERTAVVTRLQSSGELAPDLKPIVQGAADTLFERTFGKSSPEMERPATACYQEGCLYPVVFRDSCAADAFAKRFFSPEGRALGRWPGAIYRSATLARQDGRVEVSWALLIHDAAKLRERLVEATKATDAAPQPVAIPDRCGSRDTAPAPTQSSAPPEVK